jgi:hypothetical protein
MIWLSFWGIVHIAHIKNQETSEIHRVALPKMSETMKHAVKREIARGKKAEKQCLLVIICRKDWKVEKRFKN